MWLVFVQARITEVQKALIAAGLPFGARVAEPKPLDMYEFKHDVKDYKVYWDVRKGLIPIVGGARETGELRVFFSNSYYSLVLWGRKGDRERDAPFTQHHLCHSPSVSEQGFGGGGEILKKGEMVTVL